MALQVRFRGVAVSWLPAATLLFMAATLGATYAMALRRHDVSEFWPYISDAGRRPPESCVFSFGLVVSAFTAASTICVFYLRIFHHRCEGSAVASWWNPHALRLGLVAIVGMVMVAAFQDDNVLPAHVAGAFLLFGCGLAYAMIATRITYAMGERGTIFTLRLLCTATVFVSLVSTIIGGSIAYQKSGRAAGNASHWTPDQPGFVPHVVSTGSEWMMGASFLLYFVTFVAEFHKMEIW